MNIEPGSCVKTDDFTLNHAYEGMVSRLVYLGPVQGQRVNTEAENQLFGGLWSLRPTLPQGYGSTQPASTSLFWHLVHLE